MTERTTILAIGAHPDDVEFGCGAAVIKEIQRGNRVKILVLSRGEAGTSGTPEIREQESRAAAKLMGAAIEFLDFGGDCHLEYAGTTAMTLARELRQFRPRIVLAPTLDENQHPDHPKVGRMVRDAARYARYGGLAALKDLPPHAIAALYFYPVTRSAAQPDVIVDVSDVREQWEAAMRCHASQFTTKNYLELQLARAHYLGLSIGVEYAVGLYRNDPMHLDALSDITRSARNF